MPAATSPKSSDAAPPVSGPDGARTPGPSPAPGPAPTRRWRDDLRVLAQMLRGRRRDLAHAEALEAFYAPQASAYDAFRERLLPGRADLIAALPLAPGARVLDFGAGTGRHWEFAGRERLAALGELELVDLCPSLLAVARRRFADLSVVRCTEADATAVTRERPVDLVVFSYSLSMMPDWRAVLDRAWTALRPGGHFAMVDFYTLPTAAPAGVAPLPRATRWFWPRWFGHDGVWLRPEVLPELLARSETRRLHQGRARLPYLPGLRAPWFWWLGQKPG